MFAVIPHPSDEFALAREQQQFLEKSDGAWIPSFPLWAFFDGREPPLLDKAKADVVSFSIEMPRTATTIEAGEFFFPVTLVMKNGEIVRGKIVAAKRRTENGAKKINKFGESVALSHDATNGASNADATSATSFVFETRFPISCRVFRAADVEVTEDGGTRTWFSRTSVWIKTRA